MKKIKALILAVACIVLLSSCDVVPIKVGDRCIVGYIAPQEETITDIKGNYVQTRQGNGRFWWYEKKYVKVCFER